VPAPPPYDGIHVCDAGAEHLDAVAEIYAAAVRTSHVTFDLEPPPRSVWQERLAEHGPGLHLLVATADGEVAGFARSSRYRPKAAYDTTRETSVYLDAGHAGRGIGATLYAELLRRVTGDGIWLAVAGVAEPNPASTRLHEALGFERVGTMSQVGRKFGSYWDVTWWQKRLGADPAVSSR
jgi:L-amino acid N-acyltransferase YncA